MLKKPAPLILIFALLGVGVFTSSEAYSNGGQEPSSDRAEVSRPRGDRQADIRKTNPDFPTHMRPEPDAMQSLGKIPPATEVTILDMRVIQLGRFKENWYFVEYEGKSGWVRGDDLDGELSEKKFSVTYQAPELPGSSASGISF